MARVVLHLNELSYFREQVHPTLVGNVMKAAVAALRAARNLRPDVCLASAGSLPNAALAPSLSLAEWSTGRPRDDYLFILTLGARRPPRAHAEVPSDVEYRIEERTSVGVGLAHHNSDFAFSWPTPEWTTSSVTATRISLDGAEDLATELVDVLNISKVEHVDEHAELLRRAGLDELSTGQNIWRERDNLFPNLRFLTRLESDLATLDQRWVRPVLKLLASIEVAAATWDPATAKVPAWRTKITPESESRRHLSTFLNDEGELEEFPLHARFTPNAGRVHLKPTGADGRIVIAYVGDKLR